MHLKWFSHESARISCPRTYSFMFSRAHEFRLLHKILVCFIIGLVVGAFHTKLTTEYREILRVFNKHGVSNHPSPKPKLVKWLICDWQSWFYTCFILPTSLIKIIRQAVNTEVCFGTYQTEHITRWGRFFFFKRRASNEVLLSLSCYCAEFVHNISEAKQFLFKSACVEDSSTFLRGLSKYLAFFVKVEA